jgi:ABC-type multidrug transport system fused ATPase/permease subunit
MAKSKISISHVFKTIVWPRRSTLLLGLLLIIISRISGLVLPGSSKILMDEVIPSGNINMLLWLLAAVTGAIFIQAVTSFILTQILSVQAHQLIAELRLKIHHHILQLPVSYFDNNKSGALVSRIMTDVEGIRNLIGTGLVQLIGGLLTSVICLVVLIKISPLMTVYVLVPLLIFGIVSMKAFAKIRPVFKERGVINAEVTGRLTETINGIRIIKGFNAENQEVRTFEKGVERLFLNVKKSLTSTSFITSAATLLLGLASAGIMGIGGYFQIEKTMTPGDFLAFTLFLGFMIAPIIQMSNIGTQISEAFAGLDRMEEIMNINPEEDSEKRNLSLKEIKGDILFNNVSFSYEGGKEVIKDISLTAKAGSITALVGTSGSGKSTIAGLAASYLVPASGTITVDGNDLSKVRLNSYRKNLGVVLQDDFLFEGTIEENILFPRPGATREELENAVKAAYVDEFSEKFELGLKTVIGERGIKLSGGQRQRVAIARAILADPRILILDEATSSLDTESEAYIQKSLKKLMEGRTTFVIAHRLSTIRQADQILVIEQGKIFEKGTHDELMEKKGRYFELYTYQARI